MIVQKKAKQFKKVSEDQKSPKQVTKVPEGENKCKLF